MPTHLQGGAAVLVRNLTDQAVKDTTYIAHRGAVATMVLDARDLKHLGFFAHAVLEPGHAIEVHRDPMEEIYFIFRGSGVMEVDGEERAVFEGDAIHLPIGSEHGLRNDGSADLEILVVASPLRW
jgi:mannose-6-phosphate isomerase-like protein (cupin superfamily)